MSDKKTEKRSFLPLGTIVVLRGAMKKLLIISRASKVEGDFFDYGAIMYPEGMIGSTAAYFNQDDIFRIIHKGYSDEDEELVQEILNDAYTHFQSQQDRRPAVTKETSPVVNYYDPFAEVRDMADDND